MRIGPTTSWGVATRRWSARDQRSFTLVELMGVILLVLVLVALGMGAVGYVQRRMAMSNARVQITAIEAALETYRSDWGFYPSSTIYRNSRIGGAEATNNWLLYRAISGTCTGCSKAYLKFPITQLRSNVLVPIVSGSTTGLALNICDPWGKPYVFYRSPGTAFATASVGGMGYTVGGQMNLATFDLYSYGPDGYTFIPGILFTSWNSPVWTTNWIKPESATDDITNWGK